jgi:CHAT domain-containing protein/tetratricopeptide (TPR) repeat protein
MPWKKVAQITTHTLVATLLVELGISSFERFSFSPHFLQVFSPQLLAQVPPEQKAAADQLWEEGKRLFNNQQYQESIVPFEQALKIYQAIQDQAGEAKALNSLGAAFYSTGNLETALEYWQKSLPIAQKNNDLDLQGKLLSNLAIAYQDLGNYDQVLSYQQQALTLAQATQNRRQEAQILTDLGNTYDDIGNYSQSLEFHQKSLAIYQEINNPEGESFSYSNIGNVYSTIGDFPQALEAHQKAVEIARAIKNSSREMTALTNLGATYYYIGDNQRAIESQQQALQLAKELKDRKIEGKIYGNLGLVYRFLKEYEQAVDYFQKSLVIAREYNEPIELLNGLNNLGLTYKSMGNYPQAIAAHEEQLEIAQKVGARRAEQAAIGNIGAVYVELENYEKALPYLQQDLAMVREMKNRQGEAISLNNLAIAYWSLNQLPQAEQTFLETIDVLESLREELSDANKVFIFERQAQVYRQLQQVLVIQDKFEEALEISERGRARAFVDLLASRQASAVDQNIESLTLEKIKEIAKTQNATLVEYSIVSPDRLLIWVIQPAGKIEFRWVNLTPLQTQNFSLETLVEGSRSSIGIQGRGLGLKPRDPQASRTLDQFQILYQILIAPIAELLPKNPQDRVIFIPHQSLFLVPFPALKNAQGQYLIDNHTILTAPSIQVLDFTHRQRQQISGKDFLVVGNPTMPKVAPEPGKPPEPLPSLPGAEIEAKTIAQLLNTQALTGSQATKAAILPKLTNAKLVHLATHGLLDDFGSDVPGAIALAPSGIDNGLLTASEILQLKLNAELVVLSACDTGRGRLTGDGVIGLSRSLISAGVPSVLVSLWSVPDTPTASLMSEFYRQLSQTPDKAQALRNAMIKTKQQHPNPVNWAAFTLIGEAQ